MTQGPEGGTIGFADESDEDTIELQLTPEQALGLSHAAQTAAPAEPPAPPVQVRNPFDATEVFEFPAGTSETEARKAVAEQLLQRARDRRSQGPGSKHASRRRPPPGAAHENPRAATPEMSQAQIK